MAGDRHVDKSGLSLREFRATYPLKPDQRVTVHGRPGRVACWPYLTDDDQTYGRVLVDFDDTQPEIVLQETRCDDCMTTKPLVHGWRLVVELDDEAIRALPSTSARIDNGRAWVAATMERYGQQLVLSEALDGRRFQFNSAWAVSTYPEHVADMCRSVRRDLPKTGIVRVLVEYDPDWDRTRKGISEQGVETVLVRCGSCGHEWRVMPNINAIAACPKCKTGYEAK